MLKTQTQCFYYFFLRTNRVIDSIVMKLRRTHCDEAEKEDNGSVLGLFHDHDCAMSMMSAVVAYASKNSPCKRIEMEFLCVKLRNGNNKNRK